jgi:type IV pilus assembly protein PilE
MLSKGYSLIELMVVVAIIGIISAIAYPSYQGYMQDTYRAQAVADLRLCSLALERYFSGGFSYEDADDNNVCTLVSPVGATGTGIQYNITYQSLTDNDFRIRATPASGACDPECIELTANGTQSTL